MEESVSRMVNKRSDGDQDDDDQGYDTSLTYDDRENWT